jgi:hypothetical protein
MERRPLAMLRIAKTRSYEALAAELRLAERLRPGRPVFSRLSRTR